MQNDLDDPAVEQEIRVAQTKLFDDTLAKSDLSRKMQELLGVYLLFERLGFAGKTRFCCCC